MGLLFSFVIPAYNRPEALHRLLDSLHGLNFPREQFEIIVIDNYKTFQAKDWLASWYSAHEAILCQHEPIPGSHQARNTAASLAQGKYLVFLDDDCEATPNLLQAYAGIPEFSEVKMMGGQIEIKWDESPSDEIRAYEHLMGKISFGNQRMPLPDGKYLNGGNMVIDRELFLGLGGMEPDQVGGILVGSGDVGLCRNVRANGLEIIWVPEALVYHWQTLKTNGRLRDLMRREMNNGICQAYEEFRQKGSTLSRKHLFRHILSKVNRLRQKVVLYIVNGFTRQPKTLLYGNLLDAAKTYGYLTYYVRNHRSDE